MFPHNHNNHQISFQPTPMSIQHASSSLQGDQNQAVVVPADGTQNGGFFQAESVTYDSKKLQDDLQELGKKIRSHEDRVKILKTQAVKLDDCILDLQVTLGKYHSRDQPTVTEDNSQGPSEEEITEQILRQEKSGAAILYQLKMCHGTQLPWTREVLGVVATLGKVGDENLSRLLSEYLGLENMLAIVCRTFEGVKNLETYDKEGGVSKDHGLHGLGASIGKIVEGRFLVICLDSLRPYAGEFIADDPEKKLDLQKPRLPNSECPPGFLGFAVNMINVDSVHSYYVTENGHGLRETLFYNLFSRLQVYKTRADMVFARPCITHGAISLDGGMIKTTGVFSLGNREGEVKITFPKSSVTSSLPESYIETEKQLKELKWRKDKIMEDVKREQSVMDSTKNIFAKKKDDFVKCLAHTGIYATQRDREAGHERLVRDYFAPNPVYPLEIFRQRFRMGRHIFNRIVDALASVDSYFQQRVDGFGRQGVSPLQKCMAAMRMLAYGVSIDVIDDYVLIGKSTSIECLEKFVQDVISVFGDEYLRKPNTNDVQRLLQIGEERGFPSIMGSIGCMHWQWKNCPKAWKGHAPRINYTVNGPCTGNGKTAQKLGKQHHQAAQDRLTPR